MKGDQVELAEALERVRDIHHRVMSTDRFVGYSGRARAMGGILALAAAALLASGTLPRTTTAHLACWGLTALLGLALNAIGVLHWFLEDPDARRDLRRLVPTFDPVPAILVSGILTIVLVQRGGHDLLFGTWMLMYGLTNVSSRRTMPRQNVTVGVYYIAFGTACLSAPTITLFDPWPMGFVFFVGEIAGGYLTYQAKRPGAGVAGFLGFGGDDQT